MSIKNKIDTNVSKYTILLFELRNSEQLKNFRNHRKYRFLIFYYRSNLKKLILNSEGFFKIPDIMEYENSFERWQWQNKILTNLHNTLYSSQSYYEVLSENLCKYSFSKDISKELSVFDDNIHQFVRILRNYGTHIDQFDLVSSIQHLKAGKKVREEKQEISKLNLDRYIAEIESRKSAKYYKSGIRFYKEHPDKIEIIPVLINYRDKLNELHHWFTCKYVQANKLEFEFLIDKMEELKMLAAKAEETTNRKFRTDIPIGQSQVRYIKLLLSICKK